MKSIIIVGDGMADNPVERLGGRTPLMVANKPSIDRIAAEGRTGLFVTIPEGQSKGSAVANLSVLGYDPVEVYQGRAVLEAANMGVDIAATDVGVRCNLIATEDGNIRNHSAGHISNEEALELIKTLDAELGGGKGEKPIRFHAGVSYRHLMVLEGGWAAPEIKCAPPHDHVGESIEDLLPVATVDTVAAKATAERLGELIKASAYILGEHPVNKARAAAGKDQASVIWPWSPGRRPKMRTLMERFGKTGAVISAVDLVMGLGVYAGMDVIKVPGATGLWDTNYEGKADACLDALTDHDLVYVHVEATDEAGHQKDLELKIKCVEELDRRVVKRILDGLEERGIDAAVAVLPDHPTPVETGLHSSKPVPVAVRIPGESPDSVQRYDELRVRKGSLGLLTGEGFIKTVLGV